MKLKKTYFLLFLVFFFMGVVRVNAVNIDGAGDSDTGSVRTCTYAIDEMCLDALPGYRFTIVDGAGNKIDGTESVDLFNYQNKKNKKKWGAVFGGRWTWLGTNPMGNNTTDQLNTNELLEKAGKFTMYFKLNDKKQSTDEYGDKKNQLGTQNIGYGTERFIQMGYKDVQRVNEESVQAKFYSKTFEYLTEKQGLESVKKIIESTTGVNDADKYISAEENKRKFIQVEPLYVLRIRSNKTNNKYKGFYGTASEIYQVRKKLGKEYFDWTEKKYINYLGQDKRLATNKMMTETTISKFNNKKSNKNAGIKITYPFATRYNKLLDYREISKSDFKSKAYGVSLISFYELPNDSKEVECYEVKTSNTFAECSSGKNSGSSEIYVNTEQKLSDKTAKTCKDTLGGSVSTSKYGKMMLNINEYCNLYCTSRVDVQMPISKATVEAGRIFYWPSGDDSDNTGKINITTTYTCRKDWIKNEDYIGTEGRTNDTNISEWAYTKFKRELLTKGKSLMQGLDTGSVKEFEDVIKKGEECIYKAGIDKLSKEQNITAVFKYNNSRYEYNGSSNGEGKTINFNIGIDSYESAAHSLVDDADKAYAGLVDNPETYQKLSLSLGNSRELGITGLDSQNEVSQVNDNATLLDFSNVITNLLRVGKTESLYYNDIINSDESAKQLASPLIKQITSYIKPTSLIYKYNSLNSNGEAIINKNCKNCNYFFPTSKDNLADDEESKTIENGLHFEIEFDDNQGNKYSQNDYNCPYTLTKSGGGGCQCPSNTCHSGKNLSAFLENYSGSCPAAQSDLCGCDLEKKCPSDSPNAELSLTDTLCHGLSDEDCIKDKCYTEDTKIYCHDNEEEGEMTACYFQNLAVNPNISLDEAYKKCCDKPKFVYRVISTNDPFPGKTGTGRVPGNNWYERDWNANRTSLINNLIVNARGTSNLYSRNNNGVSNTTPLYSFRLTPNIIRTLRNSENDWGDYNNYRVGIYLSQNNSVTTNYVSNIVHNLNQSGIIGGTCQNAITSTTYNGCRS